jgi:hypothetical protein
MIQAIESVRREVVVPATPARAFEVFTARMTDWWPAAHHIGSAPIEQIIIEPHEGGRWYTRHEDGTETSTGFVTVWDPPHRLEVTWQISAEWRYEAALITHVEVRFSELEDGRTRVALEHRDLDRYGERAEHMRETFSKPDAWGSTLSQYAAAFEG